MAGFPLGDAADECRHHDILEGSKLRQELMKLEDETHMLVAEG